MKNHIRWSAWLVSSAAKGRSYRSYTTYIDQKYHNDIKFEH